MCARVFFFLFFFSLVGSFCLLVFRGVCAFLYNINFCVSIHFSNEDYWRHTFKHLKYSNTWQLIKKFDMQPSKVDLRLRLRLYQTLTELIELNWSKTRVLIIIIIKLYSIRTRQTQPSHCLLSFFMTGACTLFSGLKQYYFDTKTVPVSIFLKLFFQMSHSLPKI